VFVPTGTRLGPRDLDGVLALVTEAASTASAQPFELPVVERLLDLIPSDRAGYFEYRKPEGDIYKVEQPRFDFGWGTEHVTSLVKWWPLRDNVWDDAEQAVKFSDVLTRKQRLRNPWYVDVMRPRSIEHEMKVRLPAPEDIVRGFWVSRGPGGRDFDERDRAVLTVLRPYLAVFRERWKRARRPALLLTRRETEVLGLVREGLTNQEIAARLFLSAGTVRSHLENIFEKLDVHTRTAAVARAFPLDSPTASAQPIA
jgi:DNA-binding CsgD family transcriptional regulator